jgi:PAS domain S-box-containing protein
MDPSEPSIHVLHVDDDTAFAETTAAHLEREYPAFEVETAPDAGAGLDRLAEGGVDCVVSDLEMPGRDGLEFLEAVRTDYPDLPFILFTGKGSEEVASEAISAGVTDYLQKERGTSQYARLSNRIQNAVEKHRTQADLHRSERRLTLFFEESPLGVIEWNLDGTVARANPQAGEILGYDTGGLTGKSWERFVPDDEQPSFVDLLEEQEPVDGAGQGISDVQRQDGEIIICEWHNRVVTDDAGDVLTVFSQFQDVTDRKEARRRLETLAETLPGMAYRCRNEPGWPMQDIRGEVEELTGYEPAAIEDEEGFYGEQIIHPDDQGSVWEEIQGAIAEGDSFELTYRIRTRSGDTRWVWERGTAVREADGSIEVLEGFITDITDRKVREIELQERSAAMEASVDGIGIVDEDETYGFVNQALADIYGVSDRDDLVGEDWLGRYSEEERRRFREGVVPTLEAEGSWRGTAIGQRADGETFPMEVSLTRTGSGRTVVVVRDISERRAREQELVTLRDRIAFALETTDSVLYEIDPETDQEHRHGPFERIYGIPPSDADTATEFYQNGVHPADRDRLKREQRQLLAGEIDSTEVEYRTNPDHGPVRWMRSPMATVNPDAEDGTRRVIGLATDVTEQKEREMELERYETIIETSGDPMYTLDSEGHFTYVNNAMARLTGYDADELLGAHGSRIMPDDHVERGEAAIRGLISGASRRGTFEMDLITADGQRVPCENHVGLLPFDEEPQGTVGILRDISERKAREETLQRQNERLEEFASVVSHDLRNPLNVALGRLELAEEDDPSEHLEAIGSALQRMETLIDDLLTLARQGEAVDETEPLDLARVAEDSWRAIETEEADIVLDVDLTLQADPTRLKQLLENLLGNAVEHAGPDVTVEIGSTDTGFYVADNGPGIPEDRREEVFESGFSGTRHGTGFGLSIAKEIADAHGWEIRVVKSESGGARFEIRDIRPA